MDKKKKVEPIERLEKEFRAFQVEWKKFLTNDLPHLTAGVSGLAKDVSILKGDVSKSIAHIVAFDATQKAAEKSIQVMDNNILEILKRLK